jgi:hypothetical protein
MKADFQLHFIVFEGPIHLVFPCFRVDWLLRFLFFLGWISGIKLIEIRQKLQKGRKSQVLLD